MMCCECKFIWCKCLCGCVRACVYAPPYHITSSPDGDVCILCMRASVCVRLPYSILFYSRIIFQHYIYPFLFLILIVILYFFNSLCSTVSIVLSHGLSNPISIILILSLFPFYSLSITLAILRLTELVVVFPVFLVKCILCTHITSQNCIVYHNNQIA